jgi:hypothetical protein
MIQLFYLRNNFYIAVKLYIIRQLFWMFLFGFKCNARYGQQSRGICKIEVTDISKLISFGYLVGYTAEFKNNSNKTLDGSTFS